MSKEGKIIVAGLELHPDHPTDCTFQELYTWVVWQFPRPVNGGFCGAVKPPGPEHGWFPAIVYAEEGRVQVYGHLQKTFPSPETAVSYFSERKPQLAGSR